LELDYKIQQLPSLPTTKKRNHGCNVVNPFWEFGVTLQKAWCAIYCFPRDSMFLDICFIMRSVYLQFLLLYVSNQVQWSSKLGMSTCAFKMIMLKSIICIMPYEKSR
jgi:hypothetical protein